MSTFTPSPNAVAKAEQLMAGAEQQTGLRDWGTADFVEPMQVLLDGMLNEAQLTERALEQNLLRVRNLLCNRLLLRRDRVENPAIADEEIVRPIFIMGLPRSGTTHLHTLMAQDPDSRSPLQWEMMMPSPPPERATYDTDPRIDAVNKNLEERGLMTDEMRAIHPFHACLPEECSNIFEHSFLALNFSATMPLPTYRKYREQADYRPVYEYHRQFLQHLQWRCPGKRWVLKAPEHLLHLDALLEVYPDAIVIQTHRDPRKVMPSNLDLVVSLSKYSTTRDDVADLLRDECLSNWSHGADKTLHLRHNADIDSHCVDVFFNDIVGKPLDTLEYIYGRTGIPFTAELKARINHFLHNDRDSKHGKHDYSIEAMGLELEEIDRRFANYVHAFNVPQ